MDDNFKQQLLQEALRIGGDLLSKAQKDEYGTHWLCMGMGTQKEATWNKSEAIYTGVSGIVLLFLELYRQSGEEKFLQAAKDGAEWVIAYCEANPTTYYAFFTGRMGAAYMLTKMTAVTGKEEYTTKALHLVKDCLAFLDEEQTIDDLINGTSGTLLGLLHLHHATREERLLEDIDKYLQHLIKAAHFGPKGLYWDRSSKNIKGLCGFSHGAGGIGYAFLELGHYFQNPEFYQVALQAFAYEDHYFDTAMGNWPDMRKGIYDEDSFTEHREAYARGEYGFFTESSDMAAWCHGAPGIGLSRLRAVELIENEQMQKDLDSAIKKTKEGNVDIETLRQSFTLCHGGGGNAMLFLDAYAQLEDERYLDMAATVGDRALRSSVANGLYYSGFSTAGTQEDTSLFMGNAGVAYFYLNLRDPQNTPSILKPNVSGTYEGEQTLSNMTWKSLQQQLMGKLYPRTSKLYQEAMQGPLEQHAVVPSDEPFDLSVIKEKLDAAVSTSDKAMVEDIHRIESARLSLGMKTVSDSFIYIKNYMESSANQKLIRDMGVEEFRTIGLRLSDEVQLVETRWSWEGTEAKKEEEEAYILLCAMPEGVREFPLNQFAFVLFDAFETTKNVAQVLEELMEVFEVNDESEVTLLENAALDQIKEGMASGFLVREDR